MMRAVSGRRCALVVSMECWLGEVGTANEPPKTPKRNRQLAPTTADTTKNTTPSDPTGRA